MTDKILVFCTCGSAKEAKRIALHLVERRLAACASVTPGFVSHYRWKGKVESSKEVGLTVKSRRTLFEALRAEIRKVHSYETPEILAVAVIDGDQDYLDWLDRQIEKDMQAEDETGEAR